MADIKPHPNLQTIQSMLVDGTVISFHGNHDSDKTQLINLISAALLKAGWYVDITDYKEFEILTRSAARVNPPVEDKESR